MGEGGCRLLGGVGWGGGDCMQGCTEGKGWEEEKGTQRNVCVCMNFSVRER